MSTAAAGQSSGFRVVFVAKAPGRRGALPTPRCSGQSLSSGTEAALPAPSPAPDSAPVHEQEIPSGAHNNSSQTSETPKKKANALRGRKVGPQSPEHLRNRVRSLRQTYMTQSPEERQKKCSICGEVGHNKLTCPHVQNSKDMPRKNTVTCSQCGKPGHNSRSCPVRPRSTTVTCSLCGRDGHNCRTCPMRASSKKPPCPTETVPGSPAWVRFTSHLLFW